MRVVLTKIGREASLFVAPLLEGSDASSPDESERPDESYRAASEAIACVERLAGSQDTIDTGLMWHPSERGGNDDESSTFSR